MFCKNCGKALEDNVKFCPDCGTATSDQAQSTVTHTNGTVQGQPEQKSKLVAGLLGIFIGGLGIHNFYLGYTGKAVAQLLITLLSCGFGVVVTGIWALIEGIQVLTGKIDRDAKGNLLGE